MFITDNVLWSGKVAKPNPMPTPSDSGTQQGHVPVAGGFHDNFAATDGISVCVKK